MNLLTLSSIICILGGTLGLLAWQEFSPAYPILKVWVSILFFPILLSLLAFFQLGNNKIRESFRPKTSSFLWLVMIVVSLIVYMGILGIAFATQAIYFTFADHTRFNYLIISCVIGIPVLAFLSVYGYESGLRLVIDRELQNRLGDYPALLVTSVIGVLCWLPLYSNFLAFGSNFVFPLEIVGLFFLEMTYTVIVRGGSGILITGIHRGVILFLSVLIVSDVNTNFYPAAYYSSSSQSFYTFRFFMILICCSLLLFGLLFSQYKSIAQNEELQSA